MQNTSVNLTDMTLIVASSAEYNSINLTDMTLIVASSAEYKCKPD